MMQNRFLPNQRDAVSARFAAHPLMRLCRLLADANRADMSFFFFTPEELFAELANMIDAIVEHPHDADDFVGHWWADTMANYRDFDHSSPIGELNVAAKCVGYAACAVFSCSQSAFYYHTVCLYIMMQMEKNSADMPAFFSRMNCECQPCFADLQDWVDRYMTHGQYLSDEVAAALLPPPPSAAKAAKGAAARTASNATSKAAPKGKNQTAFAPVRATFKMNTILSAHVSLLYQELTKSDWVVGGDPDSFQKLFSGSNTGATVKWKGSVGVGNLRNLFRRLVERHYISEPSGYQCIRILESHFVDINGQYLKGLNKGYASKKGEAVIEACCNIMDIEVGG